MLRVKLSYYTLSMYLLILGAIFLAQTTLGTSPTPSAFNPSATSPSNYEYNHDVHPSGENFDPRKADPWGKIKCYGPLPPFKLKTYQLNDGSTANPNNWTLQQLCTKPQYGGKGKYQHLGGFCQRYTELDGYFGGAPGGIVKNNDHYRPFAFDTTLAALTMPSIETDTRLLQFCQQRCFCSAWATESTVTPPEMIYVQLRPSNITLYLAPNEQMNSNQVTPVSLDMPLGQSDGLLSYVGSFPDPPLPLVRHVTPAMVQGYGGQVQLQWIYAQYPALRDESFGYHMDQTFLDQPVLYYKQTYSTLSPANEIVCDGETPSWPWWNDIGPYDSWNMTQQTFWQTVNATTPPAPTSGIPIEAGLQGGAPFPVLGPAPPVFPFTNRSQLPITNLQQLCANALSGGNP